MTGQRGALTNKTIFMGIVVATVLLLGFLAYTYLIPKESPISQNGQVQDSTSINVGCPVEQELCYQGEKIDVEIEKLNKSSSWLAFNLPNLVPVLAVFDGSVKRSIIPWQEGVSFNLITLTSLNGKYSAQYLFASKTMIVGDKEQELDEGDVKKGDSLGLVEGFPITQGEESNGYNFQFNISLVASGIPLEIPVDKIDSVVLP